jgi:hypothetical protein
MESTKRFCGWGGLHQYKFACIKQVQRVLVLISGRVLRKQLRFPEIALSLTHPAAGHLLRSAWPSMMYNNHVL